VNLELVEIPRAQAREAAAEYSRAAKTMQGNLGREFAAIARAYRLAARDQVPMIALTPTIAKAGTVVRTVVRNRGTDREQRMNYLLPALAACKADAAFVYTRGITRDGTIELIDSLYRRHDYQSGRLVLDLGVELPHGFTAGTTLANGNRWWAQEAWSAMVPIVPPKHRPPGSREARSAGARP